jgi:mitochondrial fission protein ELM1
MKADQAETLPGGPRVWTLMGYRAGERTQILALAEALGWPFEIKELTHRRYDALPGLLRARSLLGIDRQSRTMLHGPWPDLVISAGMRNEPICRWIRAQSGGATRLVHIGRPWAPPEQFDLVITTPQYRLPERDNVLQNTGTLHRVNARSLAQAGREWAPRFAHLPRPYVGVILGGNSGPYTLGRQAGHRLGSAASALAAPSGGSLLISTSSRTPPAAAEALGASLRLPHYMYRWAGGGAENPYLGILALADDIVVTSDSVSMISEAVATLKPVHVFDLAHPAGVDAQDAGTDFRFGAALYRVLMRIGPRRLSRDLSLFHERMTQAGRCGWLGTGPTPLNGGDTGDMARAVERVRALLDQGN